MRPELQPIQLEQVRLCHWKAKPCKDCGRPKAAHKSFDEVCDGFRRQQGCASCGRSKGDPAHFGAPASFNTLATGPGQAMALMNQKRDWQDIFLRLLRESDLPRGLGGVFVEGEITFPDQREDRDQGNFRVIIEKALGDALQQGGYLERDNWTRYEFGQLTQRYQKGESATRLTLFPRWEQRLPIRDQIELELG